MSQEENLSNPSRARREEPAAASTWARELGLRANTHAPLALNDGLRSTGFNIDDRALARVKQLEELGIHVTDKTASLGVLDKIKSMLVEEEPKKSEEDFKSLVAEVNSSIVRFKNLDLDITTEYLAEGFNGFSLYSRQLEELPRRAPINLEGLKKCTPAHLQLVKTIKTLDLLNEYRLLDNFELDASTLQTFIHHATILKESNFPAEALGNNSNVNSETALLVRKLVSTITDGPVYMINYSRKIVPAVALSIERLSHNFPKETIQSLGATNILKMVYLGYEYSIQMEGLKTLPDLAILSDVLDEAMNVAKLDHMDGLEPASRVLLTFSKAEDRVNLVSDIRRFYPDFSAKDYNTNALNAVGRNIEILHKYNYPIDRLNGQSYEDIVHTVHRLQETAQKCLEEFKIEGLQWFHLEAIDSLAFTGFNINYSSLPQLSQERVAVLANSLSTIAHLGFGSPHLQTYQLEDIAVLAPALHSIKIAANNGLKIDLEVIRELRLDQILFITQNLKTIVKIDFQIETIAELSPQEITTLRVALEDTKHFPSKGYDARTILMTHSLKTNLPNITCTKLNREELKELHEAAQKLEPHCSAASIQAVNVRVRVIKTAAHLEKFLEFGFNINEILSLNETVIPKLHAGIVTLSTEFQFTTEEFDRLAMEQVADLGTDAQFLASYGLHPRKFVSSDVDKYLSGIKISRLANDIRKLLNTWKLNPMAYDDVTIEQIPILAGNLSELLTNIKLFIENGLTFDKVKTAASDELKQLAKNIVTLSKTAALDAQDFAKLTVEQINAIATNPKQILDYEQGFTVQGISKLSAAQIRTMGSISSKNFKLIFSPRECGFKLKQFAEVDDQTTSNTIRAVQTLLNDLPFDSRENINTVSFENIVLLAKCSNIFKSSTLKPHDFDNLSKAQINIFVKHSDKFLNQGIAPRDLEKLWPDQIEALAETKNLLRFCKTKDIENFSPNKIKSLDKYAELLLVKCHFAPEYLAELTDANIVKLAESIEKLSKFLLNPAHIEEFPSLDFSTIITLANNAEILFIDRGFSPNAYADVTTHNIATAVKKKKAELSSSHTKTKQGWKLPDGTVITTDNPEIHELGNKFYGIVDPKIMRKLEDSTKGQVNIALDNGIGFNERYTTCVVFQGKLAKIKINADLRLNTKEAYCNGSIYLLVFNDKDNHAGIDKAANNGNFDIVQVDPFIDSVQLSGADAPVAT